MTFPFKIPLRKNVTHLLEEEVGKNGDKKTCKQDISQIHSYGDPILCIKVIWDQGVEWEFGDMLYKWHRNKFPSISRIFRIV